MSRLNYKRLGDYIQKVEERNSDLKITRLLGLSMTKEFRETTSNIIGTDMSVYKVMRKYQFACDFMSPIRVNKLPVVLKLDDEPNLISPAYPVFKVKDHNELDPEYLMMWFRRSEFDRFVTFKCDAAIRGGYDWDELCETFLPVPHIDKQREIVKEYNTIQNRINFNQQLIQKLEKTAQAIYKHWFVDGIDVENLPNGWRYDKIGNNVKLSQGLVVNAKTNHLIKDKGIPLLRITDLIHNTQEIFVDESVDTKNIAKKEDIIITRTGQVGLVFRNKQGVIYNNCFKIEPNDGCLNKEFLFQFLNRKETYNLMVDLASGSSAQYDLTHTAFSTIMIVIPDSGTQKSFSKLIKPLENYKELILLENQKQSELKDLLLSKLAKVK